MAEHNLEWIAAFADRVILLPDGRIVLDDSPREVLTSPQLTRLAKLLGYNDVVCKVNEFLQLRQK